MAAHVMSTRIEIGSSTFWALLPVFLLVLALVGYALVDLLRAPRVRYLPKPVWALIIVMGSAPFGALAYLVLGRTRHETDPDLSVSDSGGGDADGRGHGSPERVSLRSRHPSSEERGSRL